MAVFSTIIAAVGAAAAVAGTIGSVYMSQQQASSARKSQRIAQEQENIRQRQMNLDAIRKKREIIRQQQMAMAQAQSTAVGQGADSGSALEGAYGSISGQSGVNLQGVNINQSMGNEMFALNRRGTQIGNQASAAGTAAAGFSGLSSLGDSIVKNSETISRVGTYFGKVA